jgi:hypothetical protein
VSLYDHAGKRRWERVPGLENIASAVALLAERQGKPARANAPRQRQRSSPTSPPPTSTPAASHSSVHGRGRLTWPGRGAHQMSPRLGLVGSRPDG